MNKRIIFGLLAAIAIQTTLGYFFSLSLLSTTIQSALACFIGAAMGTYVARRNFILPAILLWSLTWFLMFYILHRISGNETNIFGLVQYNWIAMLVSLLAALLGCIAVNALNSRNQVATI